MYSVINSKGYVLPYGPFETEEKANAWKANLFGNHAHDFEVIEAKENTTDSKPTAAETAADSGADAPKFRKLEAGVSPTDYRETLTREGLLDYIKQREATFEEIYNQFDADKEALRDQNAKLRELCGRAASSINLLTLHIDEDIPLVDDLRKAADSGADAPVIPEFLASMSLEARQEFVWRFNESPNDTIPLEALTEEQRRKNRESYEPANIVKYYEGELTALRNRLQVAEDTVRGLRALAGRAAAVLDHFDLTGDLLNDLRKAAREGEG